MTEALQTIEKDASIPAVQPVFITIDPDRDTPEKLKTYLTDFHPNMIGLTGSNAEVKAAAKVFRVYYSKPIEDESVRQHHICPPASAAQDARDPLDRPHCQGFFYQHLL